MRVDFATSLPEQRSHHLEQARRALAAADAHGYDHELHAATPVFDLLPERFAKLAPAEVSQLIAELKRRLRL